MTANQFKKRREKLFPALSQNKSRELAAAALGVTRQAIENWEYGRRKVPETAVKLLQCLEVQRKDG